MMQYKYTSYRRGTATDTETTKTAKEIDYLHLILSGVQVTTNIAKGLVNYFSLLQPNSCTKLEEEPNILTPFQSHVVGVFGVSSFQNLHNYLKTSPGMLIGISISGMASKTKGLRLVNLHFRKNQSKSTQKNLSPSLPPK